MSTTLLEKEYKQVSADMKQQIKNSNYICLTSDGWTNIHQQPIINFMITTPQPIFWKALESKENSHTGEYIAEQFDIVIKEIGVSNCTAIYSPVCEFSFVSIAFQKIGCGVVIIKLIIDC